jgi:hypothetical protein
MCCIKIILSGCYSIVSECVVLRSHNQDALVSKWMCCIKIIPSECSNILNECFA